ATGQTAARIRAALRRGRTTGQGRDRGTGPQVWRLHHRAHGETAPEAWDVQVLAERAEESARTLSTTPCNRRRAPPTPPRSRETECSAFRSTCRERCGTGQSAAV